MPTQLIFIINSLHSRVQLGVQGEGKWLAEATFHNVDELRKPTLHFIPSLLERDVVLLLHLHGCCKFLPPGQRPPLQST